MMLMAAMSLKRTIVAGLVIAVCALCSHRSVAQAPHRPPLGHILLQQQPQQQQQLLLLHQNQHQNQPQAAPNVYTKSMLNILNEQRSLIQNKSALFDSYFKNLLSLEKRDLHKMFSETYGLLYQTNTEIFSDLFDNLAQYYAYGSVKLGPAMESFFARLYQKIFQVLNTAYDFDQKYLKCATEQLGTLKPFGDIPKRLIDEIKESFVAAKTFLQALLTASDVMVNVMSVSISSNGISLS